MSVEGVSGAIESNYAALNMALGLTTYIEDIELSDAVKIDQDYANSQSEMLAEATDLRYHLALCLRAIGALDIALKANGVGMRAIREKIVPESASQLSIIADDVGGIDHSLAGALSPEIHATVMGDTKERARQAADSTKAVSTSGLEQIEQTLVAAQAISERLRTAFSTASTDLEELSQRLVSLEPTSEAFTNALRTAHTNTTSSSESLSHSVTELGKLRS
jgi:hypothetical protein